MNQDARGALSPSPIAHRIWDDVCEQDFMLDRPFRFSYRECCVPAARLPAGGPVVWVDESSEIKCSRTMKVHIHTAKTADNEFIKFWLSCTCFMGTLHHASSTTLLRCVTAAQCLSCRSTCALSHRIRTTACRVPPVVKADGGSSLQRERERELHRCQPPRVDAMQQPPTAKCLNTRQQSVQPKQCHPAT
jgi:hypothetical protein